MKNKLQDYFKVNDFLKCIGSGNTHITINEAAEIAQAKLNKLLESAVVVFSSKGDPWYRYDDEKPEESDTHQALLIQVEPLVKEECKHIPYPGGVPRQKLNEPGYWYTTCVACGIELEAHWKAKGE